MSTSTPTKQAPWTPGPWAASRRIEQHDDPNLDEIYYAIDTDTANQTGNRHAAYIARVDGMRGECQEANAKLIAKCPEMADALQKLAEVVRDLQDGKIWSRTNNDVVDARMNAERILRECRAL